MLQQSHDEMSGIQREKMLQFFSGEHLKDRKPVLVPTFASTGIASLIRRDLKTKPSKSLSAGAVAAAATVLAQ